MIRRKKLLILLPLLIALGATGAYAWFSSTGSGSATASTGTLTAPGKPSTSVTAGTVDLSWTAATVSGGGTVKYHVERRDDPGSTWTDVCGSTDAAPITGTSCSDTPGNGTFVYRVTSRYASWHTAGPESDPVTANGDTTPPYVLSINRVGGTPTNASSVSWTLTFSESVTGVDSSDFALAGPGATGASTSGVTGSGDTYTVSASTGSDGSLGLNLVDDNSINDGAGNPLGTSGGAGDGSFTGQAYTIDKTAPSVSSINRKAGSANPTNAASLDFTVTFSEPVSNVVAARFAVVTSSVTGTAPSVSAVTPVGSAPSDTWTVTVGTVGAVGANNGSVRLDLTSVGAIQDPATNPLSGAHTGDQSFTFDTTAPSAPASVTLANGGGSGNAFINNANKASVTIDVALAAGSSASDTVTLTVHDAGSAHSTTLTAAATAGAGTTHFTGIDLSGFNDGTITMSATSKDTLANTSDSTNNTATKDVVAPNAPTTVALTNGGGTGSVFINNANKGSVNYSVTLGPGSLSTDVVALSVSDAGNAHTVTPSSVPGTSGAGSVSFNGNNLTTLNDGTVTGRATATDLAGNTSGTTSTTNTKDVVAPSAPTTVALTNGGGTGSAFINNANKASINYSVTLGANSVTTDTISLTIADAGSAHTVAPSAVAGTAGAGTVTFNANSLTALNDGTVTASATATDQAGNSPAATFATNTKDVAAPTNVLTLTAQGSASLSGTTLYYKGNDGTTANRTFKIQNAVSDSGSGPASSQYTALSGTTTGWTFTGASTVSTPAGGPYVSAAAFTWLNPTTSSPTEVVTGADVAGNTSVTTVAFTNDITTPTNALSLTAQSGGGSFLSGSTIYYQGSVAGQFKIQNAVADTGSGPGSSSFAALGNSPTGWTHTTPDVQTTPVPGPYASNSFSWTAGTISAPTEVVTGADAVANTAVAPTLTLTRDSTAPTAIITFPTAASYNASGWTGSITGTASDGGSGVGTVKVSVRDTTSGFCADATGAFTVAGCTTNFVTATGTTSWSFAEPASNLTDGHSYTVTVQTIDNVGNTNTAADTATWAYDTTAPTVTNVTSTLANGSYKAAQVVPVTVTFSEPVTVTGTPQLTLSTGSPATTNVSYASGSGTATLTFNYTVAAGNTSADLDYAATSSLALNSGTIRDGASNNATLTLAAPGAAGSLGFNKAIVIDATAPTVTNVSSTLADGSYRAGQVVPVTVTFSEPVTVTGTPLLTLSTGTPATTNVSYASGSGTATLTFNYTVAAGNTSADLNYAATGSLALNSGTIRDAATNNATLTLPGLAAAGSLATNKNIVIDTTTPAVAITQVNGAARTFPYTSTVDVTSLGGTCTTATGDLTPITVTLNAAATSPTTATCAAGSWTLTLTTPISTPNSYSVVASQSDLAGNTDTDTQTLILADSFLVSDPGTQPAGTAFNVTITAKFGGSTDTSYSGTKTIAFTGPANAPDETTPTYPATVSFTSGVGTASIILFGAGATTLTAADGAITGTSPSFTVNPGSAAKLAWTNIVSTSTTAIPSPCLFTCSYGAFGNNMNFTAKVSVTDSHGNIVSDLGSGHTVSVTRGGDGGSFTTQSGANPQALTIATTGLASSTATFTFNSQNGSWTSDTLTAHTTAGTSYTDAAATLFKN